MRDLRLTGDLVKTVEVLSIRHSFNDTKPACMLRHLVVGSDLSASGLVNAVKHCSPDVDDYD